MRATWGTEYKLVCQNFNSEANTCALSLSLSGRGRGDGGMVECGGVKVGGAESGCGWVCEKRITLEDCALFLCSVSLVGVIAVVLRRPLPFLVLYDVQAAAFGLH
ncbi:MAG: hypothetical protein ACKERG_04225 [Candidatus Hodgkinia cicadicola]